MRIPRTQSIFVDDVERGDLVILHGSHIGEVEDITPGYDDGQVRIHAIATTVGGMRYSVEELLGRVEVITVVTP